MEKEYDIIVDQETEKTRLDVFLSKQTGLSRSQVEKLIRNGSVKLNNELPKPGHHIRNDDRIKVTIPQARPIDAGPENIPIKIIYEDKDIIVINKERGQVIHPAAGHNEGTLVNALLHHCKDLSGIGGSIRPGVVHRLDKDTSGLLVFAKNDEAHLNLASQFKSRKVKKVYLALVHGEMEKNEGEIDLPIGRHPVARKKMAVIKSDKLKKREALTFYRVMERFNNYTLLELELKTGRTHQIRVHLSHIGHPIVGDHTYSRKSNEFGQSQQLLHSYMLGLNHPITGKYLEFTADPPIDMQKVLSILVKNKAGNNTKKK